MTNRRALPLAAGLTVVAGVPTAAGTHPAGREGWRMHTYRRSFSRTATVAVLAVGAGLIGAGAGPADAAATDPTGSCDQVQDPPAQLPAGVEEGDRLFLTTYRSFVVQVTCGRLELVEPTGWDACFVLIGDDVRRYPC